MRKITQEICTAFENKKRHNMHNKENTHTDGTRLYLHGNRIAEHREDGLYITLAGWNTNTTRERLNGLLGVHVTTKQGQAFLNGHKWDGEWVKVSTFSSN